MENEKEEEATTGDLLEHTVDMLLEDLKAARQLYHPTARQHTDSSSSSRSLGENSSNGEELLLENITLLLARITNLCDGWCDPRALEPVARCMRLEQDYDQQQQRIRDAVAAQHHHHLSKTQEHHQHQ